MSSSRTATPRSTMPRGAEIRLVAAREPRAQLLKRSSLAATIVLLVITVGGILAHSYVTGDDEEPYRLGVLMAGAADAADPADATDSIEPAEAGAHASTSVLEQIKGIKDSKERPIEVVDLSGARPEAALGIDDGAPESPDGAAGTVDMVLDLTGETPGLLVSRSENSDSAVVAAVTNILQQAALSDQVTALGGDPATTAGALAQAAPRVEALDPPRYDSEDFGARYATLGLIDILMIIVIMGGGQTIAMGVVEEKSSRIVEILLACVRPGSLLAGKILGTGVAVILGYGLIGLAAGAAAELTGVLPEALFSIDAVVVAMIVWMIVGYAIAAAAYGAAGARPSPPRPLAARLQPRQGLTQRAVRRHRPEILQKAPACRRRGLQAAGQVDDRQADPLTAVGAAQRVDDRQGAPDDPPAPAGEALVALDPLDHRGLPVGDLHQQIQRGQEPGGRDPARAQRRHDVRDHRLGGPVEHPVRTHIRLDPPAGLPRRLSIDRTQHPPDQARQAARITRRPQPRPRTTAPRGRIDVHARRRSRCGESDSALMIPNPSASNCCRPRRAPRYCRSRLPGPLPESGATPLSGAFPSCSEIRAGPSHQERRFGAGGRRGGSGRPRLRPGSAARGDPAGFGRRGGAARGRRSDRRRRP